MGLLKTTILLFFLISCAKFSYITEQTVGQLALEYKDIDVKDFLEDDRQKIEYRHKVKLVLGAKKYFYDYFQIQEVSIYDEVKLLDQSAVTYLVIYSPKNKIEAVKTWFPLLGSFPYLGFFSKKSALDFKHEKDKLGYSTYMRPVYAYSTLNHPLMPFDDNILSSFFHYQDNDLIELIFHELTHTIIFVKNDISLNENLAGFVAEKLRIKYLKLNLNEEVLFKQERIKEKKITEFIIKKARELDELYKKDENVLQPFLTNDFRPSIKNFCKEVSLQNCWPLKGDWNNARFAALGTYSDKQERLEKIYKKLGLSLKDFVKKIIEFEKDYNAQDDFLSYVERIIEQKS